MASIKSYLRAWAGGASGKVWKVSWREGGEQRSKTVYTFKHAKEVKAQIEAAQVEGRRVDRIRGRIRYEDFIDHHGEEWMADLSAKARGNRRHPALQA